MEPTGNGGGGGGDGDGDGDGDGGGGGSGGVAPLKFPRSVMRMTYVEYKMRNVLPNNCQPIIHSNRRQCVSLMVSRFSPSFPRITGFVSFVRSLRKTTTGHQRRQRYGIIYVCIYVFIYTYGNGYSIREIGRKNAELVSNLGVG